IGYIGTRSIRQRASVNINAAPPGGGVTGRPLYVLFGRSVDTSVIMPFRTALFDSLQATLDRRFKNGVLMKVAYTWSKSIDYSDDYGGLTFNSPFVLDRNRAVAGFDRTHVLRVSGVAELPFGAGKRWATQRGAAQFLLSGWQVNGIF